MEACQCTCISSSNKPKRFACFHVFHEKCLEENEGGQRSKLSFFLSRLLPTFVHKKVANYPTKNYFPCAYQRDIGLIIIIMMMKIKLKKKKIIHEHRGEHPLSSTAVMCLPRHLGGRSLRPVEQEYKLTKIKAAVKLYQNVDPTMRAV